MTRIKAIISGALALIVVLYGLWLVWHWGFERVYVGHNKSLVIINRYGKPLPADQVVVPADKANVHQGIQEEVRGPGRYFINPVLYATEIQNLVQIPAGEPQKWNWTPEG